MAILVFQHGVGVGSRLTRSDLATDIKRYQARAEGFARRGETAAAKASLETVERLKRSYEFTRPERRRRIVLPAVLLRESRAVRLARWTALRTRRPVQRVARPRGAHRQARCTAGASRASTTRDGPSTGDSDPPPPLPPFPSFTPEQLQAVTRPPAPALPTIYSAIRRGRLSVIKDGNPAMPRLAIPREAALRWLASWRPRRPAVEVRP